MIGSAMGAAACAGVGTQRQCNAEPDEAGCPGSALVGAAAQPAVLRWPSSGTDSGVTCPRSLLSIGRLKKNVYPVSAVSVTETSSQPAAPVAASIARMPAAPLLPCQLSQRSHQ